MLDECRLKRLCQVPVCVHWTCPTSTFSSAVTFDAQVKCFWPFYAFFRVPLRIGFNLFPNRSRFIAKFADLVWFWQFIHLFVDMLLHVLTFPEWRGFIFVNFSRYLRICLLWGVLFWKNMFGSSFAPNLSDLECNFCFGLMVY